MHTAFSILLAGWLSMPAAAGAGGTNVGELIKDLPVETTAERDRIFKALAGAGEDGVKALADQVVDPETSGDAHARYALHGLALHFARPGAEAERAAFARAVAAQVDPNRPVSVNRFLLRQLVHAGGSECAEAIGKFVADEKLCEAACLSLIRIGSGGGTALRAGLGEARGRNRLHVIQALGALRDKEAVPQLLAAVAAGAEGRGTALTALAEIADPSTVDEIEAAARSATGYERTIATAAWIRLGRRLGEDGRKDEARDVYGGIIENCGGAGENHVVSAAIRGLVELDGVNSMPEVARAQSSGDIELAAAATAAAVAAAGEDVTRWWIERAGAGDPRARAGALRVLGGRKDAAGRAAIEAGLQEKDRAVRLAAISAAGDLGRSALVPLLVSALGSDDGNEQQAARGALLRMPRGSGSRTIVQELKKATSVPVRVDLIKVLGSRGATWYLDAVTVYLDDPELKVRREALAAVGVLGNRGAASRVVARVVESGEESERKAAMKAFSGLCRREAEPAVCAAPVLAALPKADAGTRERLLRMLADAGGDPGLSAVRDDLDHESAEVREAAVRALADWPSEDAAPDLLKIAGSRDWATKVRVIALRGYVRQVSAQREWWSEETLEKLGSVLKAAPRPEDKRRVLSAVGQVRLPAALALAETALAEETCQAEAGAAMVKIAWATYEGRVEETLAAMKRVRKGVKDASVREKAREVTDYLKKCGDYVTRWMVSGPYDDASVSLDEFIDREFAPEKAGTDEELWRDFRSGGGRWSPGRVQLRISYAGNCVGYIRTYVRSDKARKAQFEVGSDDAVKVWLNGDVVHASRERRGKEFGRDRVKVRLREGWNEVMLKLMQRTGGWEASFRVRKPRGLEVDPEGRPGSNPTLDSSPAI